jgi:hypothetical protein
MVASPEVQQSTSPFTLLRSFSDRDFYSSIAAAVSVKKK